MISLKQTTIPAVTVAQPAYNEWSLSRYLQAASVPPPEKGKQLEKLVFNIYQGISHFNKFYMPVLHLGQRSETSGSARLPAVVKYLPITYEVRRYERITSLGSAHYCGVTDENNMNTVRFMQVIVIFN